MSNSTLTVYLLKELDAIKDEGNFYCESVKIIKNDIKFFIENHTNDSICVTIGYIDEIKSFIDQNSKQNAKFNLKILHDAIKLYNVVLLVFYFESHCRKDREFSNHVIQFLQNEKNFLINLCNHFIILYSNLENNEFVEKMNSLICAYWYLHEKIYSSDTKFNILIYTITQTLNFLSHKEIKKQNVWFIGSLMIKLINFGHAELLIEEIWNDEYIDIPYLKCVFEYMFSFMKVRTLSIFLKWTIKFSRDDEIFTIFPDNINDNEKIFYSLNNILLQFHFDEIREIKRCLLLTKKFGWFSKIIIKVSDMWAHESYDTKETLIIAKIILFSMKELHISQLNEILSDLLKGVQHRFENINREQKQIAKIIAEAVSRCIATDENKPIDFKVTDEKICNELKCIFETGLNSSDVDTIAENGPEIKNKSIDNDVSQNLEYIPIECESIHEGVCPNNTPIKFTKLPISQCLQPKDYLLDIISVLQNPKSKYDEYYKNFVNLTTAIDKEFSNITNFYAVEKTFSYLYSMDNRFNLDEYKTVILKSIKLIIQKCPIHSLKCIENILFGENVSIVQNGVILECMKNVFISKETPNIENDTKYDDIGKVRLFGKFRERSGKKLLDIKKDAKTEISFYELYTLPFFSIILNKFNGYLKKKCEFCDKKLVLLPVCLSLNVILTNANNISYIGKLSRNYIIMLSFWINYFSDEDSLRIIVFSMKTPLFSVLKYQNLDMQELNKLKLKIIGIARSNTEISLNKLIHQVVTILDSRCNRFALKI